jgi:hypothetical protein
MQPYNIYNPLFTFHFQIHSLVEKKNETIKYSNELCTYITDSINLVCCSYFRPSIKVKIFRINSRKETKSENNRCIKPAIISYNTIG